MTSAICRPLNQELVAEEAPVDLECAGLPCAPIQMKVLFGVRLAPLLFENTTVRRPGATGGEGSGLAVRQTQVADE